MDSDNYNNINLNENQEEQHATQNPDSANQSSQISQSQASYQNDVVSSTYQRARKISRIDQENPFLQNFAADMNILIEVTGYKLLDSSISKYAMFTVSGKDRNGDFEIERRYSDFDQLRKLMLKRWPGCFIPPLPSKKAIGNTESGFLNERKKYLHTFCNRIAKLGYLYYSAEFQLFIRHKSKEEISKKLQTLEDISVVTIIEKFKGQFFQLAGQEVTPELQNSIQKFQQFLKTSKEILRDQRTTIEELTQSRKNTDLALRKFQKFTIQRYERDILSEYTLGRKSDMIYINDNESTDIQKQIDSFGEVIEIEPFTLLYDLINFELKDTQAFLDTLETKDFYVLRKKNLETTLNEKKSQLSDLMNGKKTLRNIFTKKDPETQKEILKNDIANLEQEIVANNELNEIIIGIIGMIEIEKYKEQKARQYYEVMTTVSKLELECLEKQQKLWSLINQTANQKLQNFNQRNPINKNY
ncbi:PX-SNX-like domain protein (macronuclear) [Tetrahymena thermophila SB210]|uniref:PX-SNX-like domain protein n=1 Tax=Tetrahymena thermophila (strain SB210) TaxID=312017 RepID=Q22WK1_TETTS|nr:PX-SNX-like domain protein [Tetrahymena thermophila SB210]EAR89416.2 PX-SNX-like domain protein [Tetrahymena thermophila SB210]|eukprot:XP_001009661.2 PX-SNX-like domain protein [Tetrahymena thermophila SB210]